MLWIILIIGALMIIYFCIDDYSSILAFIIGLVLIICASVGLFGVYSNIDTYEKIDNTQSIVSINDNSQLSGHGSAFYVSINTSGIYTYYYQLEDGGYKQSTVPANKTVIYEEDNCENPSVMQYGTYTKNNWSTTWSKILIFSDKNDDYKGCRYEIHVPKGTIVQEFNLDSQT